MEHYHLALAKEPRPGVFSTSTLSGGFLTYENVESSRANVESSDVNMVSSGQGDKKRRAKVNLRQLQMQIMAVCKDEFKSLEDIARGVGKTIKYLNNGLIAKMVSDGMLDRKYPDIPTHPGQQYKAHIYKENVDNPTLF